MTFPGDGGGDMSLSGVFMIMLSSSLWSSWPPSSCSLSSKWLLSLLPYACGALWGSSSCKVGATLLFPPEVLLPWSESAGLPLTSSLSTGEYKLYPPPPISVFSSVLELCFGRDVSSMLLSSFCRSSSSSCGSKWATFVVRCHPQNHINIIDTKGSPTTTFAQTTETWTYLHDFLSREATRASSTPWSR